MKFIPYILGAFLLIALAATPLPAQSVACDTLWNRSRIYFSLSELSPDVDAMNQDLYAANMAGVEFRRLNNFFSGVGMEVPGDGINWGGRIGYVSGSGGRSFISQANITAFAVSSYYQFTVAATARLQRDEWTWSIFSVSPRVALGLDIASLELTRTIRDNTRSDPLSIETYWEESVTLGRVTPSLDLSVVSEISIPLPWILQREPDMMTLPIGVVAGYHLAPLRNAWRSDGAVTGLSVPELSRLYFHFTLGLEGKQLICPRPEDE